MFTLENRRQPRFDVFAEIAEIASVFKSFIRRTVILVGTAPEDMMIQIDHGNLYNLFIL